MKTIVKLFAALLLISSLTACAEDEAYYTSASRSNTYYSGVSAEPHGDNGYYSSQSSSNGGYSAGHASTNVGGYTSSQGGAATTSTAVPVYPAGSATSNNGYSHS